MVVDAVLRMFATLCCVSAVGLLVTVMSAATLSAASSSAGPACSAGGCGPVSYERRRTPVPRPIERNFILIAASVLLAENI